MLSCSFLLLPCHLAFIHPLNGHESLKIEICEVGFPPLPNAGMILTNIKLSTRQCSMLFVKNSRGTQGYPGVPGVLGLPGAHPGHIRGTPGGHPGHIRGTSGAHPGHTRGTSGAHPGRPWGTSGANPVHIRGTSREMRKNVHNFTILVMQTSIESGSRSPDP